MTDSTTTKPDNPTAFPCDIDRPGPLGGSWRVSSPGMTLRDWFAGQALAQGYETAVSACEDGKADTILRIAAVTSYMLADAMLAERARSEKSDD